MLGEVGALLRRAVPCECEPESLDELLPMADGRCSRHECAHEWYSKQSGSSGFAGRSSVWGSDPQSGVDSRKNEESKSEGRVARPVALDGGVAGV